MARKRKIYHDPVPYRPEPGSDQERLHDWVVGRTLRRLRDDPNYQIDWASLEFSKALRRTDARLAGERPPQPEIKIDENDLPPPIVRPEALKRLQR